jgi:hypothetical protein
MNTIADKIKTNLYIHAIDVLYNKLEYLELKFNNGEISLEEYCSAVYPIEFELECLNDI